MRRVRNRKIIGHIAWESMIAKKSRNIIAVLAIALTTVLFTSLFTIGGSMIVKQQEQTMRQVGGSAQSGYKYLTWEEYKKVAADDALKEISYRIVLADAENKELIKIRMELSYYEDLDAKMSFCYPETGTMPKEKYDIVTSDLVLKALGIKPEIGAKVPLKFTVNGKTYEQEFRLSGWFQGDRISQSQVGCLSREYVTEIAPVATESSMGKALSSEQYPGYIMADFNFKNSFNLEGKTNELSKRLGFEQASTGVNWAYMAADVDIEVVILLVSLLLVIIISGYLIIYNIFYINVFSDIRYYGLLKTIGTTGKQLRKIVRRQAWILSGAGIPIGLMAGTVIGRILLPVIMGHLVFGDTATGKIVMNPWIFAGAAAFALITVHLSCIRPCRIAAKVSPVEAVRFTEVRNQKKSGKKGKKTKKVTPVSFAAANMRRSRKKAVIVIMSLSISLVLLNSIFSLVSGFDMDKFISSQTISDYMVTDATLDNMSISPVSRVTDGVTEDFTKELKRQKGISEVGNIYVDQTDHTLSSQEKQWFQQRLYAQKETVFKEYIQMDGEEGERYLEYLQGRDWIQASVYGIDKLIFDKMEILEGEIDWKKFKSGKYVITNASEWGGEDAEPVPYYHPGEKVTLESPDGKKKEFEVMAVGNIPYAAKIQSSGIVEGVYVIPSDVFMELYGDTRPMRTLFNAEKENEADIESWVSDYCETVNPDLQCTSKSTIVAEFESIKNMYVTVGGLLAFILAFIGILNFINTMVTSILSRRQEFAMIEAVGMTGKQLRRMLMAEGGLYAVFTVVTAVVVGLILNMTAIRNIGSAFFFFEWNLTIMPIIVCIPFLLLVVAAVPVICYSNMRKSSVVERIREVD